MNSVVLAASILLSQVGNPPPGQPPFPTGPYPYGYTLTEHYLEYGYRDHAYPNQAAYTAARLRWDPSGKTLDTGVNVGFGK